jgi:hypothetical protein
LLVVLRGTSILLDVEIEMAVVTLDATTSAKFRSQRQSVVVQDEFGHVLGRFFPQMTADELRKLEPPPIGEEEMQRLLAEPTYTTAEVLTYLESLDVPSEVEHGSTKSAGSALGTN